MEDAFFEGNSDILGGMQFFATLHLSTPLDVLMRHGESFSGPPSRTPKYGTMADGIWVPKLRSSNNAFDYPHASDIGPVSPSYYLPFLLEFRRIVESSVPHQQILTQLRELPSHSDHFRDIWKRLSSTVYGFPESFFYRQFTVLPGVGRKLAKDLYEAGYKSVGEITASSVEDLIKVRGLGKATAEKIVAQRRS